MDLLDHLGHTFNIIGITETKIRESIDPTVNIDIEVYEFKPPPLSPSLVDWNLYYKGS